MSAKRSVYVVVVREASVTFKAKEFKATSEAEAQRLAEADDWNGVAWFRMPGSMDARVDSVTRKGER